VKAIHCRHCQDVALLPGGHPYYIGRAPSRFPFTFQCFRCKKSTTITARDWNMLPRVPDAQLEGGGAKPNAMKDLGPRTPADLKAKNEPA
jgi:hypothetical protein